MEQGEPSSNAKTVLKVRPRQKAVKKSAFPDIPFTVVLALVFVLGAGVMIYQLRSQSVSQRPVTFESQLDHADLDGFFQTCVNPVLAGQAIAPSCQSAQAITQAYSFDPQALLVIRVGQMADTARRIASGDLMTDAQYNECLAQGECRPVPLIPKEIRNSTRPEDKVRAREAAVLFAHLVNRGTLTQELCAFMDECRALQKIGVVTAKDFASLEEGE